MGMFDYESRRLIKELRRALRRAQTEPIEVFVSAPSIIPDELLNGDGIKIADIPSGMVTQEIVNKIMIAWKK